MKILFDIDLDKCSACSSCAIACMDQNDVNVSGGQKPLRKIISYETREGAPVSASVSCMHCIDAPCVIACPSNCLCKDPETNLTLADTDNCIGCHSCSMACPYGAPSFYMGIMTKCDGCVARIRAGLVPACVHSCPTGALTWRWAQDGEQSKIAGVYESWGAVKDV